MIADYFNSLSKNAPVVVLAVMGLTTFYKGLGISGRWLFLSAFATGFIIGGAFQVATLGMPADFAGWFWTGITAILMGLAPSGVYDALKAAVRSFVPKERGSENCAQDAHSRKRGFRTP